MANLLSINGQFRMGAAITSYYNHDHHMKTKFIPPFLILLTFLFHSACTPDQTPDFSAFTNPDPQTYVSLMPIIREYFYLRKQAVLSGDPDPLLTRYPDLAAGADLEMGINIEAHHIASMQSLAPFDGNIHPEYYEPIRIKESGETMEILVHGMELYLWNNEDDTFNESGGEFKMVLTVRKEGNTWQIIKTDQVTLQEWKGFEP